MASEKQTTNIPDDGIIIWCRSSLDSESIEEILSVSGALQVYQASVSAGEAQTSSDTLSYIRANPSSPYIYHNPDDTLEQVIATYPCIVYGYVGLVGTGTLTLRDDNAVNGIATVLPVSNLVVGGFVEYPVPIEMELGLTAQCGTGTDELTLFVRRR